MICNICSDYITSEEYISCNNNCKYHTTPCMKEYLSNANKDPKIINDWEKNKKIKCPFHDYECKEYIEEDSFFNSSLLKQYVEVTRNIISVISYKEAEEKFECIMKKDNTNNMFETIMKNIREILTNAISCPDCKHPFVEFSGCLALNCESCGCNFCGICMKKHLHDNGHDSVISHYNTFSIEFKDKYGFHSNYFITTEGWIKWREKIKVDEIMKYLSTVRIDIIWTAMNDIRRTLIEENLISFENVKILEEKIFSHDKLGIHLVRIPNVFWILYSTKFDMKFEYVITHIILSENMRIDIGKHVIFMIRKKYPAWRDIKHKIPGESFYAVNYPPELLPLIAEAIDEWCIKNNIW